MQQNAHQLIPSKQAKDHYFQKMLFFSNKYDSFFEGLNKGILAKSAEAIEPTDLRLVVEYEPYNFDADQLNILILYLNHMGYNAFTSKKALNNAKILVIEWWQ